jgi:uroporphyrinogen-III decarboxylase
MPDRIPIFDFIDSTAFIERTTGRKPEDYLAQELAHGQVAIVGGVQCPLTTAILIGSLTNVLTKIIYDPSFVRELFKLSNEYFKVAVHKMIEARVDVICIPEDLGFASGPFFSSQHFREHLLPFIEELFDEAIRAGVPTFLHCDGNINLYLDNLLSIGLNGLHPVQRTACMSVREIRETYERVSASSGTLIPHTHLCMALKTGSCARPSKRYMTAVSKAGLYSPLRVTSEMRCP